MCPTAVHPQSLRHIGSACILGPVHSLGSLLGSFWSCRSLASITIAESGLSSSAKCLRGGALTNPRDSNKEQASELSSISAACGVDAALDGLGLCALPKCCRRSLCVWHCTTGKRGSIWQRMAQAPRDVEVLPNYWQSACQSTTDSHGARPHMHAHAQFHVESLPCRICMAEDCRLLLFLCSSGAGNHEVSSHKAESAPERPHRASAAKLPRAESPTKDFNLDGDTARGASLPWTGGVVTAA